MIHTSFADRLKVRKEIVWVFYQDCHDKEEVNKKLSCYIKALKFTKFEIISGLIALAGFHGGDVRNDVDRAIYAYYPLLHSFTC